MATMHSSRQISVASLLLFLLGAFAIDPPEHRCRTQSTRNRQARTVRMDDHDGDHNRWHAYEFDISGRDAKVTLHVVAEAAPTVVDHRPQFETESLVVVSNVSSPTAPRLSRVRDRAPPSLSTI